MIAVERYVQKQQPGFLCIHSTLDGLLTDEIDNS